MICSFCQQSWPAIFPFWNGCVPMLKCVQPEPIFLIVSWFSQQQSPTFLAVQNVLLRHLPCQRWKTGGSGELVKVSEFRKSSWTGHFQMETNQIFRCLGKHTQTSATRDCWLRFCLSVWCHLLPREFSAMFFCARYTVLDFETWTRLEAKSREQSMPPLSSMIFYVSLFLDAWSCDPQTSQ